MELRIIVLPHDQVMRSNYNILAFYPLGKPLKIADHDIERFLSRSFMRTYHCLHENAKGFILRNKRREVWHIGAVQVSQHWPDFGHLLHRMTFPTFNHSAISYRKGGSWKR